MEEGRRRQVPGKHFMERAFESTEQLVQAIWQHEMVKLLASELR